MVENFAPGALDRHGFHLGSDPGVQSADDLCLGQRLRPGSLRRLQSLRERRPVHRRRSEHDRIRRRPAAGDRRADRRFRNRHSSRRGNPRRAVSAREEPAKDSGSLAPCRTRCSISAGSNCAINSDWRAGPLKEYPQYPNGVFGDAVPRAGNASGGGQPGWAVRTQGGGPNDYIYVIIQPPGWEPLMKLCGRPELITDPEWATPETRLPKLGQCFEIIEQWTMTSTSWRSCASSTSSTCRAGRSSTCGRSPEERALRETGTVVEVDHPKRGKFLDRRQSDQAVRFADRG